MRSAPHRRARCLFFFHAPATTEIYPLSLHDALPIWPCLRTRWPARITVSAGCRRRSRRADRSEEHTSQLQSRDNRGCRLLLEKKIKVVVAPVGEKEHRTRNSIAVDWDGM